MIYLDNCATTRVFDEALEVCNIYMKEKYFNPSGLYRLSKKTEEDIDSARKVIADVIHANQVKFILLLLRLWQIICYFCLFFQKMIRKIL